MKKFLMAVVLVALVSVGFVQAATVTNSLGQVTTVTLMSETANAGTVEGDQSVWATPSDRRGLFVVHYDVAADGGTIGAHNMTTWTVPKGSIFGEGYVEVNEAILPDVTSSNALSVGGVTLLTAGVTLNSTGIKALTTGTTPGITTSAAAPVFTVNATAATQGEFTVYMPYIMGNAQ